MMDRPKRWRARLFWLFWLVLPVGYWWLRRGISLDDWRMLIQSIHPTRLALLVAFNVCAVVFFGARWWLVLRAFNRRISYLALLRYRMAAFAVSYFTPGMQFGGEPLQVYGLEKEQLLPRAIGLASVAVDKLFELLTNFTFLAVGAVFLIQEGLNGRISPALVAALAVSLLSLPLVYLAAARSGHHPFSALLRRLPAWLRRRDRLIQVEAVALDAERQIAGLLRDNPASLISIIGACVWIWLLSFSEYWLALKVLGGDLTLRQTVIAMTTARLAFLTPLPGGLGALEAGQVLAMQALGFNPALGIAISLWIRIRDLALGAIGLLLGAALVHREPAAALTAETGG
jgi:hypothetical protein